MPKYQAFISYSRAADNRLAPEIKAALQRFAKPWYKLRAIHVFCDQTNLTANPDLWGSIEQQIDNTEYFIYLASPKAADSKWVQKELHRFYANGNANKIIIVLTDGSIVWSDATANFDWSRTDAVPNTTDAYFKQEPTWLDLTWIRKEQLSIRDPRFLDAIASLSAAIRNIDKDALIGQDVAEHRKAKRFRLFSMTGLALLALFLLVAAWFAVRSERRSQERLVRTFVGNGISSLETGDYLMAFPWFVQALVNERTSDRKDLHQFRVETLYSQIPELMQVWKTDIPVLQTAFLNNNEVLVVSGPSEDWNSGDFECLNAKAGDCRAEIKMVNTETGKDVFAPILISEGIRTTQLSPDKTTLACFSIQNKLRLWSLKNGKLIWEKKIDLPVSAAGFHGTIAFDRKGEKLLLTYPSGDNNSRMEIYEAASGTLITSRSEPNYFLVNSSFLGGGDSVIFLNDVLKVWNSKTGKVSVQATPYFNAINGFQLSPDGKHLALSGSRDIKNFQGFGASVVSLVVFASLDSIREPVFTREFDFSPNKLRFDAGGNVLGVNGSSTTEGGSYDEGTRVLDVKNGNPLTSWTRLSQEVALDFDAEGKKLVLSCRDGSTEILEVGEPGSSVASHRFWLLHDGNSEVRSIFSPDGRYLLTSGAMVKLWKLPRDSTVQATIDRQKFDNNTNDTSTKWLVTFGEESEDTTSKVDEAYVFEKVTNKKIATLKHQAQVYQALLSPDGNLVATVSGSDVLVWRRENGQLLQKILSPNGSGAQSMAFSADGKRLVIAFFDFSLRVWDAVSGVPLTPYMHHSLSSLDNVSVMFSKDGKKLLSTNNHSNARLWDAATGDPLCAPARVDFSLQEDSAAKRKTANRNSDSVHPLKTVSFEDLQNYAALLSNQQMEENGSLAPISTQAYLEKWKKWKAVSKQ